jgi:hypothetical protein
MVGDDPAGGLEGTGPVGRGEADPALGDRPERLAGARAAAHEDQTARRGHGGQQRAHPRPRHPGDEHGQGQPAARPTTNATAPARLSVAASPLSSPVAVTTSKGVRTESG